MCRAVQWLLLRQIWTAFTERDVLFELPLIGFISHDRKLIRMDHQETLHEVAIDRHDFEPEVAIDHHDFEPEVPIDHHDFEPEVAIDHHDVEPEVEQQVDEQVDEHVDEQVEQEDPEHDNFMTVQLRSFPARTLIVADACARPSDTWSVFASRMAGDKLRGAAFCAATALLFLGQHATTYAFVDPTQRDGHGPPHGPQHLHDGYLPTELLCDQTQVTFAQAGAFDGCTVLVARDPVHTGISCAACGGSCIGHMYYSCALGGTALCCNHFFRLRCPVQRQSYERIRVPLSPDSPMSVTCDAYTRFPAGTHLPAGTAIGDLQSAPASTRSAAENTLSAAEVNRSEVEGTLSEVVEGTHGAIQGAHGDVQGTDVQGTRFPTGIAFGDLQSVEGTQGTTEGIAAPNVDVDMVMILRPATNGFAHKIYSSTCYHCDDTLQDVCTFHYKLLPPELKAQFRKVPTSFVRSRSAHPDGSQMRPLVQSHDLTRHMPPRSYRQGHLLEFDESESGAGDGSRTLLRYEPRQSNETDGTNGTNELNGTNEINESEETDETYEIDVVDVA
jgi:hypothetical protein